jgi:hypothetical protein
LQVCKVDGGAWLIESRCEAGFRQKNLQIETSKCPRRT